MKMQSIKRLPRSVHSPLRSSIVLFDLPRAVEELIYNSVDAGATQVSISLSVRACYIKVDDDGCGVTRDDLVILGEKYATSKFGLLDDMETRSGTFGFKGEALGSLSDISLVEVRTKARGRPNAYCKIIKGSKCLFLGIDDQKEGVGTTVVVRDIFYNQPVRRRYMQSSPKRVLHSVKKCVLRTALVHPQISFRVTDIESEDELLCTVPSSSPLPLVSDGFGNEVSNSLHRIVFSDQNLMLSGYISGPADTFSKKAFQYLYINSRFVSKGPIHNLLNSLTASLAQQKDEPESHAGKRHKTQGYPAYMLNLCCPLSSYDLNFEPSKTIIEFKEWDSVLSFFEQAMRDFWNQFPAESLQGNPFDQEKGVPMKRKVQKEDMFTMDVAKNCNKRKKASNIQLQKTSLAHSSITCPLGISSEDTNVSQDHARSSEDLHGFSLEFKPYGSDTNYFGQADCHPRRVVNDKLDILISTCGQLSCVDSSPYQLTSDVSLFLPENHAFTDLTPKVREKYDMSGSELKKKTPDGAKTLKDKLAYRGATDPRDIIIDTQGVEYPSDFPLTLVRPDIESCSLMENECCNLSYDLTQNGFDVKSDHLRKGKFLPDNIDAMDADYCSESLRDVLSQEKVDASRSYFGILGKCQMSKALDVSSTDATKPYPFRQASLTKRNNLNDWQEDWESVSRYRFPETEWCLNSPRQPYARSCQTDCDPRRTNASEWNLRSLKNIDCSCSGVTEEKDQYFDPVRKRCTGILPSTICTTMEVDYGNACSPRRSSYCSYLTDEISFGEICLSSKSNDGTHWFLSGMSKVEPSYSCSKPTFHPAQNRPNVIESPWDEHAFHNHRLFQAHSVRSGRSHSAPPFYRGKLKFSVLNASLATTEGKERDFQFSKALPEDSCLPRGLSQPFTSQPYHTLVHSEVSVRHFRDSIYEKPSAHEIKECCPVESITDELEHATSEMTKWRTGIPQPADGDLPRNSPEHSDDIFDISSGLLHLSGSSLVPESIDKDCLEDARVLLQLDRKFIPVMANGTLIIIDQHAADERIRLEELRRKVLSGEGCGIAYLDSEKELVLPEMGFQLLQKYSEQIEKWGWICSTHCQSSESLRKNINLLKKRTCAATLIAVPCILGINLTDKDLIEFMEQLVETDGSSTLPPSVLRVLNFKACRGAIMFGDSLLPSECSLIVEELKATSLCFQCAHGRPTTVPLLNMASLHEQLARLEVRNGEPWETWHGLFRHKPSIERAQIRLDFAKRFHHG